MLSKTKDEDGNMSNIYMTNLLRLWMEQEEGCL